MNPKLATNEEIASGVTRAINCMNIDKKFANSISDIFLVNGLFTNKYEIGFLTKPENIIKFFIENRPIKIPDVMLATDKTKFRKEFIDLSILSNLTPYIKLSTYLGGANCFSIFDKYIKRLLQTFSLLTERARNITQLNLIVLMINNIIREYEFEIGDISNQSFYGTKSIMYGIPTKISNKDLLFKLEVK